MEQIFIEKILINEVRHLHNIEIPLSATERKHLILTGKNGSGKTSVLEEMKIMINKVIRKNSVNKFKLRIQFPSGNHLYSKYHKGEFIFAYFPAKRINELTKPTGIQKVELKEMSGIEENTNKDFIQYIVNLKAERSFARDENDMVSAQKIDAWFEKFEALLQDIFEEEDLKLEFVRNGGYNFYIQLPNRERFDFNHLSEGYSALLSIVTEIIIRMEKKSSQLYDIQGVVLIDEVEIHLHVDLQKKILPFLTTFFPNVQFIVTTHSPFVINSISNAVVYDLENNILVSDLSGYSVEAIIKGYLLADEYSDILKQKVVEYEFLLKKVEMSEEDAENLRGLRKYLKQLPKFWSEELDAKIKLLELQHISKLKA